eukprot:354169-Chlamydomonas_euryale.AAC.3
MPTWALADSSPGLGADLGHGKVRSWSRRLAASQLALFKLQTFLSHQALVSAQGFAQTSHGRCLGRGTEPSDVCAADPR